MPQRPFQSSQPSPEFTEVTPLGHDAQSLADDLRRHFNWTLGRDRHCRSVYYTYTALAYTVRDRLMARWRDTRQAYEEADCRRAYYLSLEFLMGRTLNNALLNLGLDQPMQTALQQLGLQLEELLDAEHDAGLGNGGLGRLAACFLDSCATLQLPVMGYGIRYEYGMFRQRLRKGYQVEEPDHWLRDGNPWELERPEHTIRVQFGGRCEHTHDDHGRHRVRWIDTHDVLAVPYDTPIPGYRNGTVNTLRLWKAAATDEFKLDEFHAGAYPESVAAKNAAENITMVLYPNDASENGKELRLRQQYFLASATLQDILRRWLARPHRKLSNFAEKNCFQLNDTHPTIAVAELMRLLMDEHDMQWDEAWAIVTQSMAYTNHTLLPEALERWPVRLFANLLPRHLEIIYEINGRFLADIAQRWPDDAARLQRMSLIEDGPDPQIRMAYLALVACHKVNGVAALHSRLIQQHLFADFYALWPEKFTNKTNGVTQRRWLAACNPKLTTLIGQHIGEDFITQLDRLRDLRGLADDPAFQRQWHEIKFANKQALAARVASECGVQFDPQALFDIQVKRIHEYKRQLLNVLHIIHRYDRLLRGDDQGLVNRCILIGGKAAPGYVRAKEIIKLINNVAAHINGDTRIGERLRVVFFPDFRVTAMELICPAADLSEQISTAGKEASGTGNMKFMLNGALTIGTLDGANIEMREQVGEENFFTFGLTAEEVLKRRKHYDPNTIIAEDDDLKRVMGMLESGDFNAQEPGIFDPIIHAIRDPHDPWMTAADFRSYIDTQMRVDQCYQDQAQWTRMSILNTAASGRFSSDRTISDYNQEIWKLEPIKA
ncbi:glycogen/starch/alpha-glucan phosphorylase [Thiorhodospira sibirica]|uniref:glycogen/starch/alpha-glucan phosphorylase n=1 Tax=Thiorhodospira sibirica TaxID=154347 RepID=UPI00022C0492|nr:glycogen/starch/alpha-glucan phosphorylase [Thiorhodospira sibirica]